MHLIYLDKQQLSPGSRQCQ